MDREARNKLYNLLTPEFIKENFEKIYISDEDMLEDFINKKIIKLTNCDLREFDFSQLYIFDKLESLYILNCQTKNIFIKEMKSLKSIYIESVSPDSLCFEDLPSIENIFISNTIFNKKYPKFNNCSSLKLIEFSKTKFFNSSHCNLKNIDFELGISANR